jgi:hypothetical protein
MIKKYSINIKNSLEKTFETLHDGQKVHKWMDGQLVTEYPRIDGRMEGMKFHQTYRPFWELDGEVIAFKEPFLLGVGFQANVLKTKGTYFYHLNYLSDNETEVVLELEIADYNALQKKVVNMMLPVINKVVKAHLNSLKERAESSGAVARN